MSTTVCAYLAPPVRHVCAPASRRAPTWRAARHAALALVALLGVALSACAGAASGHTTSVSPSTSDSSSLYFMTDTTYSSPKSSVVALDGVTGRVLWSHATGGAGALPTENATVVAAGDLVFAPIYRDTPAEYHQSFLQALRASTGALAWEHTVAGPITSAPVVDGALVILTSSNRQQDAPGLVEALRATDGSVAWSSQVGANPSGVAITNGLVILSSGQQVVALREQTGTTAWTFNGPQIYTPSGSLVSAPTIADNSVFVEGGTVEASGDRQFSLIALNASAGAQLWNIPANAGASTPVVSGNTLIVTITTFVNPRYSSVVEGVNVADGSPLWEYSTPSDFILSPPMLAQGNVYLAHTGVSTVADEFSGSVVALRAKDGMVLWRKQVGSLTIGDGAVPPVLGDSAACVYLYPSTRSTSSSSPGVTVGLNLSDGSIRWQKTDVMILIGSPITHNVSYSLSNSSQYPAGAVTAVDLSDGAILWHTPV